MTNQTPIEEATGYLEARRIRNAMLRQEDTNPIDTIQGKPLTARTVQCLLEQSKLDADRLDQLRRQLEAAEAAPCKHSDTITAADLLRYLPCQDGAGRLALWCTDCAPDPTRDAPFWTEDDAAEQVTEFTLANLVAIAEQHEQRHHAEEHKPAADADPVPHTVTVTRLPAGFDTSDTHEFELLVADNTTGGWVSHLVQHPTACYTLPYGKPCWFDDEWENGQFSYETVEPGLYTVLPGHHDVGDHRGEYSHTEDYLDYERIGDAPDRPTEAIDTAGYSEESPF
jgi:hypothetical protein